MQYLDAMKSASFYFEYIESCILRTVAMQYDWSVGSLQNPPISQ